MFICPIPKSPHHRGWRFGPIEIQDWFVNLRLAVHLYRAIPHSQILIVTDFVQDKISEAEIYIEALHHAGIIEKDLVVVREGLETIEQVKTAERVALQNGRKLIIVSTTLHFPRVCYYASRSTKVRTDPFGIPRLSEAPRDMFMMMFAPLIDLVGCRDRFMRSVIRRRKSGIL